MKELQEEEAGEEALEVDLEEAFPEAVVVSAEVEVSAESIESDHDRHKIIALFKIKSSSNFHILGGFSRGGGGFVPRGRGRGRGGRGGGRGRGRGANMGMNGESSA